MGHDHDAQSEDAGRCDRAAPTCMGIPVPDKHHADSHTESAMPSPCARSKSTSCLRPSHPSSAPFRSSCVIGQPQSKPSPSALGRRDSFRAAAKQPDDFRAHTRVFAIERATDPARGGRGCPSKHYNYPLVMTYTKQNRRPLPGARNPRPNNERSRPNKTFVWNVPRIVPDRDRQEVTQYSPETPAGIQ